MSDSFFQDILEAQNLGHPTNFERAIEELLQGQKITHWIWYVLPQLRSLGRSSSALKYGLTDIQEARNYLNNEILSNRITLVANIIFDQIYENGVNLRRLMGSEVDATKTISSLTLFELAGLKVATPILNRTGRCARTIAEVNFPVAPKHAPRTSINQPHKRGLTLGKFAPLHKGHQLLIETALNEVDELIVLIYEAKMTTEISLATRARWIEILYPEVKVIRGESGPELTGDTPEIRAMQEDYIVNVLGIRGITHFYSSEFYGEHMSKALGAVNRIVDTSRGQIPISATSIRSNPSLGRDWLDPIVYRDTISNYVFLGGPGTGKSTIVERLAQAHNTNFMPEYGREYWEKYAVNRRLSAHQLLELALIHIQKEDSLLETSNQYLFTDTNALTTALFSNYYHGFALPALEKLARSCFKRYTGVFLCDSDFPFPDTEDRSGEANRNFLQEKTKEALKEMGIAFTLLSGPIEKRVDTVSKVMKPKV